MPQEQENGNVARSSHLACSISWQIWLATSNEWPRPNKPFRIASKYSDSGYKPTLAVVWDALLSHLPTPYPSALAPFLHRALRGLRTTCVESHWGDHIKSASSFSGDVDHYRSSFYATFSARGVIFVSLRLPPFPAVTAERRENCHRASSHVEKSRACPAWLPRQFTEFSRHDDGNDVFSVQPVEKIPLVPRLDRKDFSTFAIESLKNIIFLSIYLNLSLSLYYFCAAALIYETENEALKSFSLSFPPSLLLKLILKL